MVAIEQGGGSVHLPEADSHFCSSHGANCGGWNNGDCLGQIKSRGVVSDANYPYMTAFDNPPVGDPNDIPDHLWIAHCRTMIPDRVRKIYKINDISAWTGDDRKTYIANVGPLVCGFTVYQDFDNYNGGIYRHVTGNVRGGHAVLVIGYSDTEGCRICRNSWGDGFGGPPHADGTGGGFFKIAYGDSNIDGEAFHGAQGVITPASANWGGWWPARRDRSGRRLASTKTPCIRRAMHPTLRALKCCRARLLSSRLPLKKADRFAKQPQWGSLPIPPAFRGGEISAR